MLKEIKKENNIGEIEMKMNTIYLTANNEKKFASWIAQKRNNLKGEALQMFNLQVPEVRVATSFVKSTFICFWEMHSNDAIARVAPSITFATLQHLTMKAQQEGKQEEFEALKNITINFLRITHNLTVGDEADEEE